ncbi:MAG: MGMT family protein [Chloroherpetonaceae bacterium]|nr:MGMT family protein [Chloroherpetonaceae bacterium]
MNDSDSYYAKVHHLVRTIPYGKVSTYGTIAEKLGSRISARMVGYALHQAAGSDVPCHRVVNRYGALTGKIHFSHPNLMKDLLLKEGVRFKDDDTVDLQQHFYDFRVVSKTSRNTSLKKKKK